MPYHRAAAWSGKWTEINIWKIESCRMRVRGAVHSLGCCRSSGDKQGREVAAQQPRMWPTSPNHSVPTCRQVERRAETKRAEHIHKSVLLAAGSNASSASDASVWQHQPCSASAPSSLVCLGGQAGLVGVSVCV